MDGMGGRFKRKPKDGDLVARDMTFILHNDPLSDNPLVEQVLVVRCRVGGARWKLISPPWDTTPPSIWQ